MHVKEYTEFKCTVCGGRRSEEDDTKKIRYMGVHKGCPHEWIECGKAWKV